MPEHSRFAGVRGRAAMLRRVHGLALVAISCASLCGCAAYRACGVHGCPGDAGITAEVRARFEHYPVLTPPNLIDVQTYAGVVYLSGRVDTDRERELATTVAREVPGVGRVVNSIGLPFGSR